MIQVDDKGFQDFLKKASKIVSIFMKDRNTPHELARSVLQFLKISTGLLHVETLKQDGEIAKLILENTFQFKTNLHVKKHKLLVRKILNRLVRRLGIQYVTRVMPEAHR